MGPMRRISLMLDELLNRDQERYRLAATLHGHSGPVNTLSFNAAGSLLASGGDDEEVMIWDMKKSCRCQMLVDPAKQWGQITVVRFIRLDVTIMGSESLCFGTGRGQLLIYRKGRKADFLEYLNTRVFTPGDGVEAFAFDQSYQRIAITSHYGKVKMFRFEKGDLVQLWADELLDAIPRAVLFSEKGEDVSVYGMENGTVYSRDAETSTAKYTRILKTSMGNVSVCPATSSTLVDNMRDGFDLYVANRTAPIRSFKVQSTKKYVKGCVFGEGGKLAVCGSDHGRVYVFGIQDENLSQELVHGSKGSLIQTVQSVTADGFHFIASGASDSRFDIAIWKRPVRPRVKESEKLDPANFLFISNLFFVAIFAWLSRDIWLLPTVNSLSSMSTTSARQESHVELVPERQLPSVNELLHNMDDATLRKLLGIPSLQFGKAETQSGRVTAPAVTDGEEVERTDAS